MDFLKFNDVHFSYPTLEGDVDQDGNQIIPPTIFDHFTATLPCGFVHLVGPNGSGKSTLMLLASGRLLPSEGFIELLGHDTRQLTEQSRSNLASYIYQNMELETDEKISSLLDFVYKNGNFNGRHDAIKAGDLIEEIKSVFELDSLLDKKMNGLSKGELQRVLLSFSLLCGSKSIFMDEPLFALEDSQKENALCYLKDFCKKTHITIYISMHEIDLTKKYAQKVMLFYPNHNIDLGTPKEVLTNKDLEKAYGVPVAMLKHSEDMTRKSIQEQNEAYRKMQNMP